MFDRLDSIRIRYEELEAEMNNPPIRALSLNEGRWDFEHLGRNEPKRFFGY